ncbi:MAG: cytochrome c biogenesis protein CcsA, partial [Eggerthellaceae bacterium]|nr:cytochrome c biogenesis protein CcsA [Eggerthellaceae bacterium]
LKKLEKLDSMALMVSQVVLLAFLGVLLFSESNMPFTAMPEQYFNSAGQLQGAAVSWGMNTLLEHWAMAIHPPTLFIGYAGLTIPFAYAIGALIVNDPSKAWVERSTRYALFSWLFLGIGIGLGSVWAYVVLGWGGYWGWDPVENASLLSWLVGVALIHSFTVYRQRGGFRRWSVMCACLTFAFVIVGTFISRSGLVQSVHAFEGDPVSLVLFLALIILSVLAGAVGLVVRWKSFGPGENGVDDVENMLSKDAAYYFNNVIMVVFAVLLAYMTISSALPEWMPFGGEALTAGTYNTIARPLGIVYLGILAVCPLLSWGKTTGKQFWKRARIPGICALVMFVVLMVYFVTYLLPSYNAIVAAGGTAAEGLLEQGPAWYYNGLTVVGFFVASVLFFNSLWLLGRGIRNYARSHKTNVFASAIGLFKGHAATYGGFVAHFAMAIILVGLIGSSMYVTEKVQYIAYDEETDTAENTLVIQDFELVYTGNSVEPQENGDDILYIVEFDVFRDGEFVGHVSPSVQLVQSTQQQKLNASVIGFPLEDLFVVYRGVNMEGDFAMDVRVNPLISFVWAGFGLLMLGMLLALVGRRNPKKGEPEVNSLPVKEFAEAAEEDLRNDAIEQEKASAAAKPAAAKGGSKKAAK